MCTAVFKANLFVLLSRVCLLAGHYVSGLGRWETEGPISVSKSSSVVMTCRVTQLRDFTATVIRKRVGDNTVLVTENGLAQGDYRQDRYVINFDDDSVNKAATITLNITGE